MTAQRVQFAKNKLQSVYWLNKKIQANKKELAWLRSMYAPPSTLITADKVQTSIRIDKLSELTADIIDLEHVIQDDTVRLIRTVRDIKNRIDRIPDYPQRLILQKRYINFEKWERIASDFDMELRGVFRLHSQALQAFADI